MFITALFSKENMVIFFPLTLLITLYFFKGELKQVNKRTWLILGVFGCISLIYIGLKFTVFNFTETVGLTTATNEYTQNLHIRLITFVNIIWDYAKLIFYPNNLYYEKPYEILPNLFSLKGVFGLIMIGIFIFSLFSIKKRPVLFLGCAWIAIGLLPYMGIIPLNAIFLEHWLYVPIIGFMILAAGLSDMLIKLKMKKCSIGGISNAFNSTYELNHKEKQRMEGH